MTADNAFTDDSEQPGPEQLMAQHRGALEQMLARRLNDAVQARQQSGIELIWEQDEDQYNGVDEMTSPVNVAPVGFRNSKTEPGADPRNPQRSRVFLNITKSKADVAVSRVQEMLLPHDDKPWEIEPTPVPELMDAAAGQDDRMLTLADGSQKPAQDVAKALLVKADEAAKRMSTQVDDWFVEGGVYAQLRKVIRSAGKLGTGILKGPIPTYRKDRRWRMEQGTSLLEIQQRLAPTSVAKSVWDVFPDPSCGENPHDGAYIFDRDYLTGRKLRELATQPGYDSAAIAQILAEGPRKRTRFDDRQSREQDGQVSTFDTDTFEVFYYYGDIPPETLIATGYKIAGLNDAEDEAGLADQLSAALQLVTVPVVVCMVNERIVKVSMNPLETGEFPFDFFVWEQIEGQPWGRGIPNKMAVAQRGLNAAARAMMENAGMSAGPQIVIAKSQIEPANGIWEITGRKLWYWTPSDDVKDVREAFQSVMIDSAQEQLQAIIDFFLRMADELSNMPLLMQGIVGNQAPETLGGQAMAQANATSPLKAVAKQYDDFLIVPHLKRYYSWAMQDPDVPAEAKGDMQCKARGSSVLIYRDVAAQFLPQLAPMIEDPKYRLNPAKWMAEVLRGNKVNPASLQYTDDEAKAIEEQMAEQGAPKDPRVQAAEINAQAKAEDRKAAAAIAQQKLAQDSQENELDRAHESAIADIEFQIQAMEFAGQKEITLEQLRAMLAAKALDIRNKREMASAEYQFARTDGEGRGI